MTKKNNTTPEQAAYDAKIRAALSGLTPEAFQQIRDAYYKAVDGLIALAEALEENAPAEGGVLIEAHLWASQAETTLDKARLGKVL
jgi:hypothetical protein